MKTVFFGSRQFVFPVIDVLASESELVGIITKPDAPAGRGEKLTPSPVKAYGEKHYPSVPIFTPEKLDDETYVSLQKLQPDLFVVAAYGLLIPNRFLDLPTKMTINIHPSLLPLLRGASPLQSALLQEGTITGVSIMKLDEQMDHGPLIWQEKLTIEPNDTFLSLGEKSFRMAAEYFPTLLKAIEDGQITLKEQDHTKATFCHHITREDGYIDINNPPTPEVIDRMIRAYDPWPNVWSKIKIKNQESRIKFFPGMMVQVEGKKKMPLKEFLNGYPDLTSILTPLFLSV